MIGLKFVKHLVMDDWGAICRNSWCIYENGRMIVVCANLADAVDILVNTKGLNHE